MSDKSVLHLSDVCKEIYNNDDCKSILCDNCPLSHEEIATKILIDYIKTSKTSITKLKMLKYKLYLSRFMSKSFIKMFVDSITYIPKKIKKLAKWWWNKWT